MKIVRVRNLILKAPLEEQLGNSQGWVHEKSSHLIEIATDEGITGIGEVFGAGHTHLGHAAIIDDVLGPMIIGADPFDVEVLWHKMHNGLRDYSQRGMAVAAMSGIDIACWDIKGKALMLPLHQLLGGKFTRSVTPYASGFMFHSNPSYTIQAEAEELLDKGYRAFKIKVGETPALDLRRVSILRESVGADCPIMVDANHAYSAHEALKLGRGLEDLDCAWLEEPIAPEDRDGLRELRTKLDIPIAAGENEYTRWGFRELLTGRCVDILQPEVCGLGGITEYQKVYAIASAWFTPIVPHVWGSCVASALALHLIAALPPMPGSASPTETFLECDTSPNPLRDNLNSFPILDPAVLAAKRTVPVPQSHGLGIDLDGEQVARYLVQ